MPEIDFNIQVNKMNVTSYNFPSLFNSVKTSRLGGTWPAFENLLDNYILKTGNTETVTSGETNEMNTFLDQVMSTEVMQLTYDLLYSKGKLFVI